ncbi:MAG TPA: hypothetical protein VGM27_08060 [Acidobacteriaceae bacterium]
MSQQIIVDSQTIFESPQTHTIGAIAGDDNSDGKAPVTIFVLDLLAGNVGSKLRQLN